MYAHSNNSVFSESTDQLFKLIGVFVVIRRPFIIDDYAFLNIDFVVVKFVLKCKNWAFNALFKFRFLYGNRIVQQ